MATDSVHPSVAQALRTVAARTQVTKPSLRVPLDRMIADLLDRWAYVRARTIDPSDTDHVNALLGRMYWSADRRPALVVLAGLIDDCITGKITKRAQLRDAHLSAVYALANQLGWCDFGTYGHVGAVWPVVDGQQSQMRIPSHGGRPYSLPRVFHVPGLPDVPLRQKASPYSDCDHCPCGHECDPTCISSYSLRYALNMGIADMTDKSLSDAFYHRVRGMGVRIIDNSTFVIDVTASCVHCDEGFRFICDFNRARGFLDWRAHAQVTTHPDSAPMDACHG